MTPKRTIKDYIKAMMGIILIFGFCAAVGYGYLYQKDQQPKDEPHIFRYYQDSITYLVIVYKNNMQVINYSKDSVEKLRGK